MKNLFKKQKFGTSLVVLIIILVTIISIGLLSTTIHGAATVDYQIQSDWGNGAVASVTVKNTNSSALDSWKVTWSFSGNQKITSMWGGAYTQNGTSVEVTGESWNSTISGNGSVNFGFMISYSGTNSIPTNISVNGSSSETPNQTKTPPVVTAVQTTTVPTTSNPTSKPTTPSQTTTPPNVNPDSNMGGFASVAKYGVKTTTGGAGGKTVTVSNFNDLKNNAESDERLVIKVSGTISAPGAHGLIKVQSNKTIIGVGSNARLNKITLSVNSWDRPGESCDADDYGTFTPASNVIIRNLEFTGLADFPDDTKVDPDCIRVESYSHHVWIDHNTFQYGADGATDVKRGADMVTISYNHYVKTKKTALVGHSDNTGDQDRGFLNVTFHHNFFDGTETRTPRVRWGYVHVYNNYYDFKTHAFRIGPEGKIYAEGNYVASTSGKILRDTENEGHLTWTNTNVWDKSAFGDVGNKLLDADQSVSKPSYNYSVDSASSRPPAAGAGKI